ncbi:Transmembrane transcriptional regulator (anti-sigma factor RsiW) [Rhizobium sp. NFR07]|uniref:anti-sigma factor family protein n=1 Tax=Rhizobium sp. NFR07 TaxID=1566262 RepID=UPI0008EFDDDD|nr:anti-sigma factor [Rhizobium sp. NFR07]SFB34480.1 Transmembrane transcriptional regulator (anti-sigma factor RsiW) [Rhizobium sp. NFR07]
MTIDSETMLLLNAYHDGELSAGEALSMQHRIEREPELAAFAAQFQRLSSELIDVLPGEPAPEHLRGAIFASLADDLVGGSDEETDKKTREMVAKPAEASKAPQWRSIAAALLIGIITGALGGTYGARLMSGDTRAAQIENEILAAHLRGLIAPQPFDIASSENHVVKPWFNGKTTIAPTAPDFAAQGFLLVGGRVDVIGGTPVPVMVYKRRQHTISVTVTTAANGSANESSAITGTNVRSWTDGGLTYWAVSDLNPAELSSFADLYRRRLAGAG